MKKRVAECVVIDHQVRVAKLQKINLSFSLAQLTANYKQLNVFFSFNPILHGGGGGGMDSITFDFSFK